MKYFTSILLLAFTLAFSAHAHAATRDEQRAEVQKMQDHVLAKLYKFHPGVEKRIANGVGFQINIFVNIAIACR